jgi:solute carrier family 35 protein E3
MDFNLKMNSVGFCQLSKLLCIPSIVIYEIVFHGQRTPLNTVLALAIFLAWVGLFTVINIQVNFPGTIIACLAVVFVAISQTKTGAIQAACDISGPTAQYTAAFNQFLIALSAALCIETTRSRGILTHDFQRVVRIGATGGKRPQTNAGVTDHRGRLSASEIVGERGYYPIAVQVTGARE